MLYQIPFILERATMAEGEGEKDVSSKERRQ